MTKPGIVSEKSHDSVNQQARRGRVKRGVIRKIFHILFGGVGYSITMNKITQNIHALKESQLIQQ